MVDLEGREGWVDGDENRMKMRMKESKGDTRCTNNNEKTNKELRSDSDEERICIYLKTKFVTVVLFYGIITT